MHSPCCISMWFSPADLPGWLVEPGAHSFLPVFVKVWVQNHSIPARGHGCLLPCKIAKPHGYNHALSPAHQLVIQRSA